MSDAKGFPHNGFAWYRARHPDDLGCLQPECTSYACEWAAALAEWDEDRSALAALASPVTTPDPRDALLAQAREALHHAISELLSWSVSHPFMGVSEKLDKEVADVLAAIDAHLKGNP